jgi:hypothetical protein
MDMDERCRRRGNVTNATRQEGSAQPHSMVQDTTSQILLDLDVGSSFLIRLLRQLYVSMRLVKETIIMGSTLYVT